eukprot:403341382
MDNSQNMSNKDDIEIGNLNNYIQSNISKVINNSQPKSKKVKRKSDSRNNRRSRSISQNFNSQKSPFKNIKQTDQTTLKNMSISPIRPLSHLDTILDNDKRTNSESRRLHKIKKYYNSKKLHYKNLKQDEKVIFECVLLKLCPGVNRKSMKASRDLNGRDMHFVERWCQITKNNFRYYKSKICAYQAPEKPLISLPLDQIQSIIKSKINKEETQFEIVMQLPYVEYVGRNSKFEKAQMIYLQLMQNQSKNLQQKSNKFHSPDREVVPGHLMRLPNQNTDKNRQRNSKVDNLSINYGQLFKSLQIEQQNQKLSNQSISNKYRSNFVNDESEALERIMQEESMLKLLQQSYLQTSSISNVNANIQDKNQWSKREQDWFNIEERLIFKNDTQNIVSGNSQIIDKILRIINKQKKKLLLNVQGNIKEFKNSKSVEKQDVDQNVDDIANHNEQSQYMLTFSQEKLHQV